MRWGRIVLAVVTLAGVAHARPPDDVDPPVRLSDLGLAAFNRGQYTVAIKYFQASYQLSPVPAMLFNIAQAYRLDRDCPRALEYYRRYEQTWPDAPNRMLVDGFIADMERCPLVPPPGKPPLYKKWWLWTAVGVAAAALSIGLGVGLSDTGPPHPSLGTVTWHP